MIVAQQQQDNKKEKAIAAMITALIMALILIFLYLYVIITPNPPFPMSEGSMGEQIHFGIYNEGTGNIDGPGIGDATSVVVDKTSTPKTEEDNAQDKPFDNGEAVLDKKSDNPKIENNKTVITPQKTKEEIEKEQEDAATKNLLNAFVKNKKNGQSGGEGTTGKPGTEGGPEGSPDTHGRGGEGNDPNHIGIGKTPGPYGKGAGGFSLSGRKILVPPPKVSDGKEEGVVVVYITVDKQGNVIEADPNGKGTTTSSGVLKSKARQAALQAKFDPAASDKTENQRGSIVFKFQF